MAVSDIHIGVLFNRFLMNPLEIKLSSVLITILLDVHPLTARVSRLCSIEHSFCRCLCFGVWKEKPQVVLLNF